MTRSRLQPYLTSTFLSRNPPSGKPGGEYNLNESFSRLFSTLEKMETAFINSLFPTCACQDHTAASCTYLPLYRSSFTYHKTRRRTAQRLFRQTRSIRTLPISARPLTPSPPFTRNEYLHMLDYNQESSSFPPVLDYHHPFISALDQSVAQIGRLVNEKVIASVPKPTESATQIAVERLLLLLDQEDCPHDAILEAYSALPFPGVVHLPPWKRRLLLRRLSTVEKKNSTGLYRYLSIVDDMKAADLPITDAEWNSILAFTGRCFSPVQAAKLESALQTWKEMEQDSTVQSGEVTFNILFDLAAKAGKYVLAELILKEMRARNLPLNRYARTSIIYYYGLQEDGDAVRDAYRAYVQAGEIVDTAVMNCVIAALILAGEPQAADFVYERMKRMYSGVTGDPPPSYYFNWKRRRHLGRILNRAVRDLHFGSEEHRALQNEQLLCPDLTTYAIIIEYHVLKTGELGRIMALLEEMQALRVPIHGRIFVKVLKGFAKHGGVRYTSWSSTRLEHLWTSLLEMLDCGGVDEAAGYVHLGKWMVVWAMRAFYCCCGHARAMDIWAELRSRWKPSPDEEMAVLTLLEPILQDRPDQR